MRIKATITEELSNFYATFCDEECSTFDVTCGEVSIIYNGNLEVYGGPYDATPKTVAQTLPTAQKALMDDVTVYAIPYAEVTNNSGGTTATIGG